MFHLFLTGSLPKHPPKKTHPPETPPPETPPAQTLPPQTPPPFIPPPPQPPPPFIPPQAPPAFIPSQTRAPSTSKQIIDAKNVVNLTFMGNLLLIFQVYPIT